MYIFVMKKLKMLTVVFSESEVSKLQPIRQIWPTNCF